jgi:hypothetical protein
MSLTDRSSIESELGTGERLLWKGRPRAGIRLRGSDALLIPFSLLWGGFAIFWEYTAVFWVPKTNPAGWLFPLFGFPFVLAGLYFIFGRFVFDAKMRESTEYAVTDRRAIIVTTLFGRKVNSINLQSAPDMSLTERSDRSGTITFGAAPYYGRWSQRNLWYPGTASQPAFDMIDDARSVYDIIQNIKRD